MPRSKSSQRSQSPAASRPASDTEGDIPLNPLTEEELEDGDAALRQLALSHGDNRPGATVPLAGESERLAAEAAYREYQARQPAQVSPAEIQREMAGAMAAEQIRREQDRLNQDITAKVKADKALRKVAAAESKKELEELAAQKPRLAMQNNLLRKYYADRFPEFPWKKHYDSEKHSYGVLLAANQEIKLMLNAQHAPGFVKSTMQATCYGVERALMAFNVPADNSTANVTAKMEGGFLDDEAKMLAVEYMDILGGDPKIRAIVLIGQVFAETIQHNVRYGVSPLPANAAAQRSRKAADL
jgi:hypothetical protein